MRRPGPPVVIQNQNQNVLTCTSGAVTTTSTLASLQDRLASRGSDVDLAHVARQLDDWTGYIAGWFTERIGTFETNRAAWVRMLLGAPFEEALGLGA